MAKPNATTFTRARDISRIARSVKESEGAIQNTVPTIRGPRVVASGLVLVKTTTTITARSGSTPGTGDGVLVSFDGTDLVDGAATITLRNLSAKTGGLASGKYGYALPIRGEYWVVSVEC